MFEYQLEGRFLNVGPLPPIGHFQISSGAPPTADEHHVARRNVAGEAEIARLDDEISISDRDANGRQDWQSESNDEEETSQDSRQANTDQLGSRLDLRG